MITRTTNKAMSANIWSHTGLDSQVRVELGTTLFSEQPDYNNQQLYS